MKTAVSGLLLLLAPLLSPPASAQTIKLATLAPDGSPWHNILRDMATDWSKITNGKIQLRIYAGGVAGDEPDMVRKLRVGQIQAAVLTGNGLAEIAQEIQALQMPMMLSNDNELDHVMERVAPKFESLLQAKGFKVLNWGDAGWVRFFTQKPVVAPADLKPLRLFAWAGDSAYLEAWKDAGYNPVSLPANEIHTGLQSGLINAFVAPPIAALAFQWFGLAKHMTDLQWAPLIGAAVIGNATWQRIPDDLKPLILKSSSSANLRFRGEIRKLSGGAVEVMKKHGLTVHPVPPEIASLWEKSARAGYPKIVGRVVPAQMVAEVERFRDEYRALQKP
ncbi:MAG TPA: TRAP transporter substrate-binding protein DctP [Candidatus Binatia bacterium]|nr:TRAP transporter substrate-binding protein DctP [Candidatus Binatia bacterium]